MAVDRREGDLPESGHHEPHILPTALTFYQRHLFLAFFRRNQKNLTRGFFACAAAIRAENTPAGPPQGRCISKADDSMLAALPLQTGWGSSNRQLTDFHTRNMVFHMKTTLSISDATMRAVKREAARRGQTMSELVESALRQALSRTKPVAKMPPLPSFSSGGSRVDVSDRDALFNAMER